MSMQEVIIIFEPLWQDMERDDPPVTLPDLADTSLSITSRSIFKHNHH